MQLTVIFLLFILKATYGLIGYDCGAKTLNVTTVSLLDVEPCDIPENSINVTTRYIQLLQFDSYTYTKAVQCKIEISRSIHRCGAFSHNSIVHNGYAEYLHETDREKCLELYHDGIFRLNNVVISGVKVNRTDSYPVTLAGKLETNGECDGEHFSDFYGSWSDVVVQAKIKFTIRDQTARVDLNNNKVHLHSGTVCQLITGHCIDGDGGYTYWNTLPTSNCKFEQYNLLYEGYANKMRDDEVNSEKVIYSFISDDVTFALATKAQSNICGYNIIKTEHPKLIIFETIKGETFVMNNRLKPSSMDLFTYVNSKFVYTEKHLRMQIKNLYRDIMLERCRIERDTLKNSLAIATQAPDQFAYNLMKGPGYMAVVAGEVIHIIKCVAMEVKLDRTESCYMELPVIKNRTRYFLTPKTRILKSFGTKTYCNSVLPPIYQIHDGWYKMLPSPTETHQPKTLKPLTKPTWKYVNPANLATSGIYTEEDLEQLKDRIMFPVEQPALLNDIAREIHSRPISDDEGALSKLLSEDAMNKIVNSTWIKIWEKLTAFGTASAGVIAIFIIFHAIKTFAEMLINGYLLHQAYGWSLHLVGALWSTLANYLLHLSNNRKGSKDTSTNEEDGSSRQLLEIKTTEPQIQSTSEQSRPGFFNIS